MKGYDFNSAKEVIVTVGGKVDEIKHVVKIKSGLLGLKKLGAADYLVNKLGFRIYWE